MVSTIFVLDDNLWASSLIKGSCKKSCASNTWNNYVRARGGKGLPSTHAALLLKYLFFSSPINMECLIAGHQGAGGGGGGGDGKLNKEAAHGNLVEFFNWLVRELFTSYFQANSSCM